MIRFNGSTLQPGLIFFAFVFFRGHYAIVDCVGMKHYRAEVEEKETQPPASRREGGQQYEKSDWNRAKHPEKAHKFVSFIDVSQTGNDTQDNCYCVARFAFGGFRRAALPIAPVTALRITWQEMPAIRTRHFISRA